MISSGDGDDKIMWFREKDVPFDKVLINELAFNGVKKGNVKNMIIQEGMVVIILG